MDNVFANTYETLRQESYLDKLFKIINTEKVKPKEFSADISPDDAAEIMSDRFIEAIKIQMEKAKRELKAQEESV
jgi:hypothetical protein